MAEKKTASKTTPASNASKKSSKSTSTGTRTATTTASATSSNKSDKKCCEPSTKNFPTQKLQSWLKGRNSWNHQDWLELLKSLEKEGFADLISTQNGRDSVGAFLESNRK